MGAQLCALQFNGFKKASSCHKLFLLSFLVLLSPKAFSDDGLQVLEKPNYEKLFEGERNWRAPAHIGTGSIEIAEPEVGGENERPPHERVIESYSTIMNGETSLEINIPTDLYGSVAHPGEIIDRDRLDGKVVREPAIVNSEPTVFEFSSGATRE